MNDAAALQLLRLPSSISLVAQQQPMPSSNNNHNNNSTTTKARSQTVNGKPLALDVSSLIGKPSTSGGGGGNGTASSASDTDAPLNLSMKTKEETVPALTAASTAHGSNSSRLGRGVSMPKKNTVASLLAQSRNQQQRSGSPGGGGGGSGPSPVAPQAHAASNPTASSTSQHPSAAEIKAIKDNLVIKLNLI